MRKNIFLKIPTSCDRSIQIPGFCIITLQCSLNVKVLYQCYATKLELLILQTYTLPSRLVLARFSLCFCFLFRLWSSWLCQCPTPAAPKMLSVRLRAFLLLWEGPHCYFYNHCHTAKEFNCVIRHYVQFILSPSITPSYTFLPNNNVHPVLRKVIIKYSCLRNRHFIHRSAHTYHQVQ